ncbi:hypothetical protein OSB04_025537 [Centaurea solstitialis]|uniref:Integrase catalytic domain-containing protein n=1 Tax=Centaurea solstitialis TaxID=347529 RepID=A0AA38T0J6_9ASTR|nr:hypothetical protein OSB04_025537 [Centaurea solstitialis]
MADDQPMWGKRSEVQFTSRSAIKKTKGKMVEINKGLIKMINTISFDGEPSGNPYQHLEAFEDICDLFNTREDEVKLRVFSFTLTNKAKDWFKKLPPGSITTWDDLKSVFLSRYFPISRVNKVKAEIRNFKQGTDNLVKAWERLDSSCEGIFLYKSVKEARKLLDDMEAHYLDWSTDEEQEEKQPTHLNVVSSSDEHAHPTEDSTWKPTPLSQPEPHSGIIEQLFHQFSQEQGKMGADVEQNIQGFVNFVAGLHRSTDQFLRDFKETFPHMETEAQAEVFTTTRGGKVVVGPPMPQTNQIPNLQVVEPEVELPSRPTKEVRDEAVRPKESATPHVPLVDLIAGVPSYARFLKELVDNKARMGAEEIAFLNAECSSTISDTLKKGDPGSFTIPCYFGKGVSCRALADLGASINLMPLSFYQKLGLENLKSTRMTIQLADRSIKYPVGIAEDVTVWVDKFTFRADFVILDIKDEVKIPLILGRPFLNTASAVIHVAKRELSLGIGEDRITLFIDGTLDCEESINTLDNLDDFTEPFETKLTEHLFESGELEESFSIEKRWEETMEKEEEEFEELKQEDKVRVRTSLEEPPNLGLKNLPEHLEYQFLEGNNSLPVIISSLLTANEKERLIEVLKKHKKALAWKISDIPRISPSFCTHKILMEDNFKPCVQKQRRLNPKMQEVVKKEVIKLLDTGIIYPISDSPWVSPVQVVPKKGGLTVVTNDNSAVPPPIATNSQENDKNPIFIMKRDMSNSVILFYTPEEALRLINTKWKLTGQNFPVWKMHLDNILRAQGKLYVLDKPVSRPKSNSPEKEFTQYFKYLEDESDVMSILIFSISPELVGDLRVKSCHEVVKETENQSCFYKHTGKLLIMKEILSLKLRKNQSVKDHLIEMRRLFKCLTRLGYKMTQEELVYLMWYSLPKEICDTASAYMKEPKIDMAKVHENILASLEPKPSPAELMDSDWIDELGDLSCPECGSRDICEHSMNIDQIEIGLLDAPGIFMIDCLITSYESWVIDTRSGNHICNHLQGFTRRETLRKDRSNLRVGEGTPLIAEADDNKEIYHISKRSKDIEDQTYLWHCRLGHINKKRVELLLKGGFLCTFDFKPFDNCESCLSGKMTKKPFNKDNERATDLLEIVHTDVCGPFSHEARGGYRYFITFTDDFSRYGYVYLMRHKSESFEKFREYQNEVQNQLDRKIKFLRSDRGGEYLSQEFGNHLMECGIVSQLTPPYTHQMNGVSERRNRTLLDMVRSMMCRSTLPISFWGHALEIATHILNKAPTKLVEKTPYEFWKGLRQTTYLRKTQPKSDKCFFVGYPKTTVGYYFYNPKENKVFVARIGKFLEEKFLSSGNTREDVDLQVVDEDNTAPTVEPKIQHENVEPQSESIEEVQTQDLRRSTRVRQEPDRYLGFLVSQVGRDLNEPTSYGEAVLGSESEQCQETMKAEMQSMYDNQVWELTDLPQHCRAVGRKWVFKKKTDMDGNVHTFKARLVAKGFTQTHGIDYDETYSPVAMLKSIRILMAISAYFNYEIWQIDVKTAFLNGKLTEDRIKEFGFAKSEFEPCVYAKFSGSIVTFLVLYVDDILLIGNDVPTLQSVKSWLSKCFQMKDLGEAAYILSIKIYRNRSKWLIGLSQKSRRTALVVVKNILKYMRRTKDMFLVFGGSEDEISVTGYSDASFQTDRDDFRSQSGYVFTLNGGAISWKSSKQDTIADSTTEAEYIAASDAAKEAVWLRNFLSDLRVVASISRPIDIFYDNSGVMEQAKEPREHHKSRHMLRKYHLIREIIGRGDVRICKIPTEDNVADPLTKPLARVKHEAHASSIGMQYLDTSSWNAAVKRAWVGVVPGWVTSCEVSHQVAKNKAVSRWGKADNIVVEVGGMLQMVSEP